MVKIGIVGEPQTGKSSLLALLLAGEGARRGKQDHEAVIPIPDPRLDWLKESYQPKKTTPASLEFADLGGDPRRAGVDLAKLLSLQELRLCDGIAVVLACFQGVSGADDLASFELATAVADLDLVERRLERLVSDRARGKMEAEKEMALMERLKAHLESEHPLRTLELIDSERAQLKGYQFLSIKPVLVVANVSEDDAGEPELGALVDACAAAGHELCALSAPIEAEISSLDPEERSEFMSDLGITEVATSRFLRSAYASLGLISFLTVGPDECRAWSVERGATAPVAAGKIHSDLQRGFIRAEVVSYPDLALHGDEKAAKAAGVYRLEGKDYLVQDGDVMEIRFSV